MTLELVVAFCVVIAILLVVRIVPDRSRFAVLVHGKFHALKGPGLVVRPPWASATWVRLSLGDQGTLMSNDLADFGGVQIPVKVNPGESASSIIRIAGFDRSFVIADRRV